MKDFCTRPATDSGIVRDRGALFSVGVGGGGGGGGGGGEGSSSEDFGGCRKYEYS